jgi:hypothetical protein
LPRRRLSCTVVYKSILQRKTQVNVRHLQTQNNAVQTLYGHPPPKDRAVDSTNHRTKLRHYEALGVLPNLPVHLVTLPCETMWHRFAHST